MSVNGEIWNELRRLEQTIDALAEKVYHLENPKKDSSQRSTPAKKTAEAPKKAAESKVDTSGDTVDF